MLKSGPLMSLECSEDNCLRWLYENTESTKRGGDQDGLAAIGTMLVVARQYCGPTWVPSAVIIPDHATVSVTSVSNEFGTNVYRSGTKFGMFINDTELNLKRHAANSDEPVELKLPAFLVPAELASITAELINLALIDDFPRIEKVAALMNITPRTLQRRLNATGISFRQLVKRQLVKRAAELLLHSNHSIAQISGNLKYSDPSHFIRAFISGTGETPLGFRERLHATLPDQALQSSIQIRAIQEAQLELA